MPRVAYRVSLSLLALPAVLVLSWSPPTVAEEPGYTETFEVIRQAFLDAQTRAAASEANGPTTDGPSQPVADVETQLAEEEAAAETDDESDMTADGETATPTEETAEEAAADTPDVEETDDVEPQPQPLPPLSPQLSELRNRMRKTLRPHYGHTFNTKSHTPVEIMAHALAFGGKTQAYSAQHRKSMPALGLLCYGYTAGGKQMLRAGNGRVVARVGHGAQTAPGELLAVLAMSRVAPTYPVAMTGFEGTVADLVKTEMRQVRTGADNAYRLIGLSFYHRDNSTWQNDFRETWSLDRLIDEEVKRRPAEGTVAAPVRLTALAYAVRRAEHRGYPASVERTKATEYLNRYQDFVYQLQNSDGSFHPNYFASRGPSNDTAGVLAATGHIAEFLVMWAGDEEVTDPRLTRTLAYLTSQLGGSRYVRSLPTLSTREIVAARHACHALMMYDRNVFAPYDEQAAAEVAEQETTSTRQR